jgi:hypothetical protein
MNENIKKIIFEKLEEIIEIPEWNMALELKIKILHNFCNKLLTKDINKPIEIALKSLKPKQLIQNIGFNKKTDEFKKFQNDMINYTFDFREKYKNVYYSFMNLKNLDRQKILTDINKIFFNNINTQKINALEIFNNIVLANKNKVCIFDNNFKLNISINDNYLLFYFNENISIKMELCYGSDKITNNIPVFYKILLCNII